VRGQRHAPTAPYPRERPGNHCTGGCVGLRFGLDRCGKCSPHRDFFFLMSFIQCFMLHSLYRSLHDDTFECIKTLRLLLLSCYVTDGVFHVSYPCFASARQLYLPLLVYDSEVVRHTLWFLFLYIFHLDRLRKSMVSCRLSSRCFCFRRKTRSPDRPVRR